MLVRRLNDEQGWSQQVRTVVASFSVPLCVNQNKLQTRILCVLKPRTTEHLNHCTVPFITNGTALPFAIKAIVNEDQDIRLNLIWPRTGP